MTTEERMVALMAECRRVRTQQPHPRFSNALGCLRSHAYDFRLLDSGKWPSVIEKPVRWNFAAEIGNSLGRVIEQAAERLGALTQIPVLLDGIDGTMDIEWPDSIWDLKLVGEFAWRKAKKYPDPKNVAQVNAYSVARGKPRWALIYLPIHMLGKGEALEWIAHEGQADADKAKADVTDRWAEVARHRAAGTLPDREVDRETCYRLRCLHREECWAND